MQKRAQAEVPGRELLGSGPLGSRPLSTDPTAGKATADAKSTASHPQQVTQPHPMRRSVLHADGATSPDGNLTSGRKEATASKAMRRLAGFSDPKAESESDSYSEFGDDNRLQESTRGKDDQ